VPKSTRIARRARLGIVLADRLAVEGHRVESGPKGAPTITCTGCKAPRLWDERRSAYSDDPSGGSLDG